MVSDDYCLVSGGERRAESEREGAVKNRGPAYWIDVADIQDSPTPPRALGEVWGSFGDALS